MLDRTAGALADSGKLIISRTVVDAGNRTLIKEE